MKASALVLLVAALDLGFLFAPGELDGVATWSAKRNSRSSSQGATITGQVVDAWTRQPLRGAIVSAARMPSPNAEVPPNIGFRTGPDGKFILRDVAPGIVSFFVTKAGYAPGPYASLRPAAGGEQIDNLVLTVLPGASLSGRVVDESGQPIAGETVTARRPGRPPAGPPLTPTVWAVRTDDDGRYWIGGLSSGELDVAVGGFVDSAWILSFGGELVPSLDTTGRPTGNLVAKVALADTQDRTDADIVVRFGNNYAGTRPSADGDAAITGLVVDRRGVGVPHSAVVLRPTDKNATITARTDGAGRFQFNRIPPGSFTLQPDFGSAPSQDERLLTKVQVAAGSRLENIVLTVNRGGAISGVLTDEFGDPVTGAVMAIMPVRLGQSGDYISTRPEGMAATGRTANADARGRYRITGLAPGEYLVNAATLDASLAARTEIHYADHTGQARRLVRGPLFYPGVPTVSQALKVAVTEGSESAGVDFTLRPFITADINVTVTASRPVGDIQLFQFQLNDQFPMLEKTTKLTGSGVMLEARPGRYRLLASADVTPGADNVTRLWSSLDVDADPLLPARADMVLEPGANISGRIVFEGKEPNRQNAGAWLVPMAGMPGISGTSTLTVTTGEFLIEGVMPGRYVIQAGGSLNPRSPWMLKAAIVRGRDVLDEPIDLGPGEEIADVRLTVTDRISELSGKVTDSGEKPGQGWVLVFSIDKKHWWPGSRRVRVVRTNADGQYVLRALPTGTYVVTPIANPPAHDELAEKLPSLTTTGVRVTIAEGDRKVQDLRVK